MAAVKHTQPLHRSGAGGPFPPASPAVQPKMGRLEKFLEDETHVPWGFVGKEPLQMEEIQRLNEKYIIPEVPIFHRYTFLGKLKGILFF